MENNNNTYWQDYIKKLKLKSKFLYENISRYAGIAYRYIINFNEFDNENIQWAIDHALKYCNETLCDELIEHCRELLKLPIQYRKDIFDYVLIY